MNEYELMDRLDAMASENIRLQEAVRRVRELHRGEFGNGWCAECCDRRGHLVPYPCPTIKALDGTP